MFKLADYTEAHRLELEKLLDSAQWQKAIGSGLVEEAKALRIEPGKRRDFVDTVVHQLLGFNEGRVEKLIRQGCADRDYLFRELSRWPEALHGREHRLSFLGLNVTSKCDAKPRCIYCNQPYTESVVDLDGWKGIVEEATANGDEQGPYVYIRGGEPLTLGAEIWGDDGLVRFATERRATVCEMWDGYQAKLGVPEQNRAAMSGYFSSPFSRVAYEGGLDAYVRASAEGRYGKLALAQHCYVAPTQAAFTPDGYQYRCGSHAIRRILPVGNIAERGVLESIREGMSDGHGLPQEEYCYGCALATLYINQTVESKLKDKLESMLRAPEIEP